MEEGTGISSEVILETIYSPSESVVAAVETMEAERRRGTWPKELVPWQIAQLDPSQWGEAVGVTLS